MVGLRSDEQRHGFVSQLQSALFAWIKQNPAADGSLRGLFVMDEAQALAPSNGTTACTASTFALIGQARRYGLGLVFATPEPRALHGQVPANAATHMIGRLDTPVQAGAATEMAQARGSSVPEIGALTAGLFYAATDGQPFQKVWTPVCLTHHATAPLTPEEVVARARG